jgi:hypothetical protein
VVLRIPIRLRREACDYQFNRTGVKEKSHPALIDGSPPPIGTGWLYRNLPRPKGERRVVKHTPRSRIILPSPQEALAVPNDWGDGTIGCKR